MNTVITPARPRTTDVIGEDLIKRIFCFCLAAAYSSLLLVDYVYFISPQFSYMNFLFYSHGVLTHLLDCLIASVPAFFLPVKVKKPSDLALILLYIIVAIPSFLMLTAGNATVTPVHWMMKGAILVSLVAMTIINRSDPASSYRLPSFAENRLIMILLIVMLLSIAIIGQRYGFSLSLPSLSEVYSQRDEYKSGREGAGYIQYVVGIATNVLAPGFIALAIQLRRPVLFAPGVLIVMFIFSVTGLKSAFMSILYTILIVISVRLFKNFYLAIALSACMIIVILAMALQEVGNFGLLNDLFVRRLFIIQGTLVNFFIDYFADRPKLYLSKSILSGLFLNLGPSEAAEDTIGQIYFGGVIHANASIWSDGFANGGIAGVIVSSILSALFLRFINFSTSKIGTVLSCGMMCMIFMMFCQTALIRLLFTHAGMFACLLYMFCRIETRLPRSASEN